MTDRREFIRAAGTIGAGVLLGGTWRPAWAESASQQLAMFVQPLREVGGAGGIPVAASDGTRAHGAITAAHYSLRLEQFEDQLHPALPNATRLWGYRASNVAAGSNRHLGGVFIAQRGTPVQVTATNALPAQHILPVDVSIMGAERGQGANHASLHLHGGLVPWISDGGPHTWFDPAGGYGASVVHPVSGNVFKAVNPALAPGQAEYFYPNMQGARMLWYHDHALGITRLNAYAGLASAYVITDDYESLTMSVGYGVPGPADPRTKYLIFQDKVFVGAQTQVQDPEWHEFVAQSRAGDLWYPHEAEVSRSGPMAPERREAPEPSVVPEFFGDTMLVNGTVAPFMVLEQRQYRLRLLNACNARFLNPRLLYARGAAGSDAAEPQPNQRGLPFIQIGSDTGFLPAPVMLNGPRLPRLLLAPAERADLIVDLRDVPAGTVLLLYNDAAAPFPNGDPAMDFHPGNPRTRSAPGSTPNTRSLLQIRVVARTGAADAAVTLPSGNMQNPNDGPFLVAQQPGVPTAAPPGVPVRRLTLNEAEDEYGRLIQTLGTDAPVGGGHRPQFGRAYDAAATETVNRGSVEVWQILNLTADTHPMHFHLANVQVLSRQAFNGMHYRGGAPHAIGPLVAPDGNELGWRETVRMNPGEVTSVIMRFDLPAVPFTVPPSPRTGGNEYVWHCHILEHEEHDMMRPLVVT